MFEVEKYALWSSSESTLFLEVLDEEVGGVWLKAIRISSMHIHWREYFVHSICK